MKICRHPTPSKLSKVINSTSGSWSERTYSMDKLAPMKAGPIVLSMSGICRNTTEALEGRTCDMNVVPVCVGDSNDCDDKQGRWNAGHFCSGKTSSYRSVLKRRRRNIGDSLHKFLQQNIDSTEKRWCFWSGRGHADGFVNTQSSCHCALSQSELELEPQPTGHIVPPWWGVGS